MFKSSKIIDKIYKKHKIKRLLQLVIGSFLIGLSFNIFLLPQKIVIGGISGVSIITEQLLGIDPSSFILIANLILLIIGFIFLEKRDSFKIVIGSILFPLFIKLTENINLLINTKNIDNLTISLVAGAIIGFGTGLILKAGYSSGGSEIIAKIIAKFKKTSMGKATFIVNFIIIGGSILTKVSSLTSVIYAIIILYINSIIIDKVLLGISRNKAFHIFTTKEREIKEYIKNNLTNNLIAIDAVGGFSNKKIKMLLCVIPTIDYFKLKDKIFKIDKNAYFLITDAFEVKNIT